MSDTENPIDYDAINKNINALYEVQLKSSDKIESIITYISSIFIGAVASFYAIIGAPIEGKIFWALLFFITCIIINCVSYVLSYWCMQFAIEAEIPGCKKVERYTKLSNNFSNSLVVMDHISLGLFLGAIILSSIGTYSEYSNYIHEKRKQAVESVKCEEPKKNEEKQTEATKATRPTESKVGDASPAGFRPPPKTITPPQPKLKDLNTNKEKKND